MKKRKLDSNEIKALELDLLIKFDKFCKEKGITYTMCGGTLLGAVRHKGFIPWDDDIDVLVSRDDFTRFEGHEFSASVCYDYYLKSLYGDYMKLPPEDKRISHNIEAYIYETDND